MNIIKDIESEQISEILKKREVPDFKSGDTLKVNVFVTEGNKERVQAFEGVCIARSNRGFNSTFTVRKVCEREYFMDVVTDFFHKVWVFIKVLSIF